ncbi:MAG: polyprenyl synthetase family protein, partial [Acidobacteriota bacterium]|nr:polyprenyl synthetase family protein [Acidobacteriota bacterium]
LAFEVVAADENLDYKTRVDLILDLAVAAGTPGGMAAGQQLDLQSEGKQITAEDLEQIHRKKTGALIVVSARAGARIGGAEPDVLRSVSQYADLLGLLYQITDDLLDVTQTTDVLGKTAGKDATAEKATYPSIYGIEETRKLAVDVHRRACEELVDLEDSTILMAIADRVLDRKA